MLRFLLCLTCLAVPSFAQQITRHEAGVGFAFSTDTPFGGVADYPPQGRMSLASPELRYTFNLNRNVAFETELADSYNMETQNVREGGHQLLALGGIKAGIRRGRFGFFGTSAAGVASFSRGAETYPSVTNPAYQRVTHFALQQGAAIEYSATARTLFRLDVAELLDAQFRRDYVRTPSFSVTTFAGVPYHLLASLSVAHRFGGRQQLDAASAERIRHDLSVGGLYVMGIQEHLLENDVRADGGGGAWVGFPLWRFLSADLLAFDQPHQDHTAGAQDGGTTFASFLGPKIGFRKGPIGLYAKARPGIMRFSRTNLSATLTPVSFSSVDRPKIDFAIDTGLVLDYIPPIRSHRMFVRFEAGSDYIHYRGASLTDTTVRTNQPPLVGTAYFPPARHSNLLFLTGLGFCF